MSTAARAARLVFVVGVAGFWVCAHIGAQRAPGYEPTTDYLSALAAVGAAEPGWGLVMFGFGSLALLGTSLAAGEWVRGGPRWWHVAPASLLLASVATAVAGVARVRCPSGAAGCSAGPTVVEPSLVGQVHAAAVVSYQVLLTVALLVCARIAWHARRRWLAGALAGGAVVTPLLAVDVVLVDPGWSQRLWVATGHGLLALVVFGPASRATVGE